MSDDVKRAHAEPGEGAAPNALSVRTAELARSQRHLEAARQTMRDALSFIQNDDLPNAAANLLFAALGEFPHERAAPREATGDTGCICRSYHARTGKHAAGCPAGYVEPTSDAPGTHFDLRPREADAPRPDAEAVKWAIDLLEIHPGVKANANSRYWLRRLEAIVPGYRPVGEADAPRPDDGRWTDDRLTSAPIADVLELLVQLVWRVARGGTQHDEVRRVQGEILRRSLGEADAAGPPKPSGAAIDAAKQDLRVVGGVHVEKETVASALRVAYEVDCGVHASRPSSYA